MGNSRSRSWTVCSPFAGEIAVGRVKWGFAWLNVKRGSDFQYGTCVYDSTGESSWLHLLKEYNGFLFESMFPLCGVKWLLKARSGW